MGRDPGWREEGYSYSNEGAPPARYWCQVLSAEGHKYCDKPYFCGCECHLPANCEPNARWRKRLGRKCDKGRARRAGKRE